MNRTAITIVAFLLGTMAPVPAGAVALECNNVEKMARCCSTYLKSLKETVTSSELTPAHQCQMEIEGALDEAREEKYLGACVPDKITPADIARSFVAFSENNHNFYTRSPRFGLLYLMSFKWPCNP